MWRGLLFCGVVGALALPPAETIPAALAAASLALPPADAAPALAAASLQHAGTPIPRILWFFWSAPELPNLMRALVSRHRRFNPSWEFRVLHPQHHLIVSGAIEPPPADIRKEDWQHVSDWYRAAAIKRFGGVWLDVSTIAFGPIERWVDVVNAAGVAYQGFSAPYCTAQAENWAFAAPEGSPFMAAWLDEFRLAHSAEHGGLDRFLRDPRTLAAVNRTCPTVVASADSYLATHYGVQLNSYLVQHYAWAPEPHTNEPIAR